MAVHCYRNVQAKGEVTEWKGTEEPQLQLILRNLNMDMNHGTGSIRSSDRQAQWEAPEEHR